MKKNVESEIQVTTQMSCEFCKRKFVRPINFQKHICEAKKRWNDKGRPNNRIGFTSWIQFYQKLQPRKKAKSYQDFMTSPYYGGFIKFGTYCVEVKVIDPASYVKWLTDENVPLDNWTSDRQYSKYLLAHLRNENGLDALSRSLKNMIVLAEDQNLQLGDVFRYSSASKICYMIVSGRISPWVIYNCNTGIDFLSKLNNDQQVFVYEYIDPEKWQIKFKRSVEQVAEVKNLIREIPGL